MLVASVSMDSNCVVLADLKSGQKLKEINHESPIASLLFSDCGRELYLGTLVGSLIKLNLETCDLVTLIENSINGGVASLQRIPDKFQLPPTKTESRPASAAPSSPAMSIGNMSMLSDISIDENTQNIFKIMGAKKESPAAGGRMNSREPLSSIEVNNKGDQRPMPKTRHHSDRIKEIAEMESVGVKRRTESKDHRHSSSNWMETESDVFFEPKDFADNLGSSTPQPISRQQNPLLLKILDTVTKTAETVTKNTESINQLNERIKRIEERVLPEYMLMDPPMDVEKAELEDHFYLTSKAEQEIRYLILDGFPDKGKILPSKISLIGKKVTV